MAEDRVSPLTPDDPTSIGAYKVVGRLGAGGQGHVYLGETSQGEPVAIKVLHPMMLHHGESRARFAREIAAARRVAAFCTAKVVDFDVEASPPYVVNEYIAGPSLQQMVTRNGPLGAEKLERLAVGTATALTAIHEAGILHRDFKPGNVLLADDGPRVVDFGIARSVNTDDSLITATGMVIGTPSYMAPEQVTGDDIGPPVDVFAWGATMVFGATGRSPFEADSVPSTLYRIMHDEPDLTDLPPLLRDLVAAALSKDPAQRPSARELLQHLLGMTSGAVARPMADAFPAMSGTLERRYQAMDEGARTLLRRAALLQPGQVLTHDLAMLLVDLPPVETTQALSELRRHRFVVQSGEGEYRLVGDDVRDFALDQLARAEPSVKPLVLARLRLSLGRTSTVRPRPKISSDIWTVEDRLGARPYASAVAAFLRYRETEPPLTIGISGPWGSGKTSLMRMVREEIDPADEDGKRQPIRLTSETWLRLGRRRRRGRRTARKRGRVRNGDVLRRLRDTPRQDEPLTAEPTPGTAAGEGWRPTVWFNPWMYQTGEQVWAGLAHEIITQVTERLSTADRERFWLEINLRRVDREEVRRRAYRILQQRLVPLLIIFVVTALVGVGGLLLGWLWPGFSERVRTLAGVVLSGGTAALLLGTLARWTGFLRESAGPSFGRLLGRPDTLAREATDAVAGAIQDPGYQSRVGFLHLVHSDMRQVLDLVATPERPLVVFVDDLDRCAPGPVAQVVEAINLFLAGEFPNCVFIVAMEPDLVAAHVEAVYAELASRVDGDLAFGWRFLEKVVQLPLRPPTVTRREMSAYLGDLLGIQEVAERQPPRDEPDASRPPGMNGTATAGQSDDVTVRIPVAGAAAAAPPTVIDAPIEGVPSGGTDGASGTSAAAETSGASGNVGAGGSGESDESTDEAQPREAAPQQPDPDVVERLVARIREMSPTLASLPAAARAAQEEILNAGSDDLQPATIQAFDRVFADLYGADISYQALKGALAYLEAPNARTVKRYVNLFRFITFIAYHQQLGQGSIAPPPPQLAKLTALLIRWPHLLSKLSRETPDGETALAKLQAAARSGDPGSTWIAGLQETRTINTVPYPYGDDSHDDLRAFLASGEEIGPAACRLL